LPPYEVNEGWIMRKIIKGNGRIHDQEAHPGRSVE